MYVHICSKICRDYEFIEFNTLPNCQVTLFPPVSHYHKDCFHENISAQREWLHPRKQVVNIGAKIAKPEGSLFKLCTYFVSIDNKESAQDHKYCSMKYLHSYEKGAAKFTMGSGYDTLYP